MAETRDADAVYAEIIAKMPQPLADMYWRFSNQYSWTLIKWQEYQELFASPEQVDLLNRAAPAFFASLQTILFLDLVMDVGDLREALESMAPFLNEIERHYGIGPCAYDQTIGPLGGVDILVQRLEKGLEMERREHARLRGEPADP